MDHFTHIYDGLKKQVRAKQGGEILQWFKKHEQMHSNVPKLHSSASLDAKAAEVREKRAAEELRRAAALAGAPAAPAPGPGGEEEQQDGDDDLPIAMVPALGMFQRDSKGKKGKGAGRHRRPSSHKGRLGAASSMRSCCSMGGKSKGRGADDTDSVSGSTAGPAPSGAGGKSVSEKVEGYRQQLDPLTLMSSSGDGSGRVVWQAGQTLVALRRKDPANTDAIMLEAYLEKAKKAQSLSTKNINGLSRDARKKVITEFQDEGLVFPCQTQCDLVAVALKD